MKVWRDGDWGNLKVVRTLSEGSTCKVFVGKKCGKKFALKVLDKKVMEDLKMHDVTNEIKIIKIGKGCPFIVDYLFGFQSPSKIFLLLEFCPGGDLLNWLDVIVEKNGIPFYSSEIAMALDFLHKNNVFYGDLKPENITLGASGHIRLIDFGLALQLENPDSKIVSHSGTLGYCSPEVLQRIPHGVESDWWSFGIVIYELMFGDLPFWNEFNIQDTCKMICFSDLKPLKPLKNKVEKECFQMCEQLLQKKPEDRICGVSQLEKCSFYKDLNWKFVPQSIPPIKDVCEIIDEEFLAQDPLDYFKKNENKHHQKSRKWEDFKIIPKLDVEPNVVLSL